MPNYGDLENGDVVYGDNLDRKKGDTIADVSTLGLAGMRGQSAREAGANWIRGVGTPQFDLNAQFEAPGYAGDFTPEDMALPSTLTGIQANESPEGRAAQLAALQQLAGLTDQSVGSTAALGRYQAENDARQLAQSREGAIRQDSMRRGQLGGAADMIARQQAGQAAANMNLNAGMQTAQQAALQRLMGTQAQGSLAGQLRGQDQSIAFKNADILNAANAANWNARNGVNAANTQAHNQAGMLNLGNRQQILNAGADARNQSLSRRDQLTQQDYGNRMGKATNMSNALNGIAAGTDKQGDNYMNAAQMLMRFYGGGSGGK